MANLQYSSEILDDILFRADELTDGTSDHEAQALIYLNRAYRSLWMGGGEFAPNLNEVWWWLKAESSIVIQKAITSATIAATQDSASVTFSANITPDLTDGWYLKVDGFADVFKFTVHGGTQNSATLDSVYTGETVTAASCRLMKLEYDLASDCLSVIDDMRSSQDARYEIKGMAETRFNDEYPLTLITSGTPDRFTMIDEDTVRFNRYLSSSATNLARVDYDYLKKPADLTDSGSEEPLVPLQYRHVLSDMALYFIHMDKENTRAIEAKRDAMAGIKAMQKENIVRWQRMGDVGQIYPRLDSAYNPYKKGPLRTDSGLIIG